MNDLYPLRTLDEFAGWWTSQGGSPAEADMYWRHHAAGTRLLVTSPRAEPGVRDVCQLVWSLSNPRVADGNSTAYVEILNPKTGVAAPPISADLLDQAATRALQKGFVHLTLLIAVGELAVGRSYHDVGFILARATGGRIGKRSWLMRKALRPRPQSFSQENLMAKYFRGFRRLDQVRQQSDLPAAGGVYVVVRTETTSPSFATQSPAHHFKGRDPTMPVGTLQLKWVPCASVVYIGKADTSLHDRVDAYLKFGVGEARSHWGGRYLWQLAGSDGCLLGWRVTRRSPFDVETEMLQEFTDAFGALPYANLPPGTSGDFR